MAKDLVWESIEIEAQMHSMLSTKKIVLFGAGAMASRSFDDILEEIPQDATLMGFCDNDPSKWGLLFHGFPCFSLEKLKDISDEEGQNLFVIITSPYFAKNIQNQLQKYGICSESFDTIVIKNHMEELFQVYRLLSDEISRKTFVSLLLDRMHGDGNCLTTQYTKHQYFCLPPFQFLPRSGEVFIDCGAYCGEISQAFIENTAGSFKRIYMFEPGEVQYRAIEKRMKWLRDIWGIDEGKIIMEKAGVGKENGVLYIQEFGENLADLSISSSDEGAQEVRMLSLDTYFKENPDIITFLKADIEGSEQVMLDGAVAVIKRDKPKMAISLYHKIKDFYRIPLSIKKLVSDYQFSIRHHWNTFSETVLYCYFT